VPVVALRGEEKVFAKNVDVYIHAQLDPEPRLEPFHPLRDPNMTHKRSTDDGSLPPVFSVNVYDVGYFDGSGKFKLLFNLRMTKEENAKQLHFNIVHSSLCDKEKFQIWNDKNIKSVAMMNRETPFFL
jgi:hypothetical protein